VSAVRRLVLGLVAGGLLLAALLFLNRPLSGPLEPVWDKEACAYCRMHLGERAFAAEARTADGETLFFDDPGCLLLWSAGADPQPVATWFHHATEPRWLAGEATGFVPAEATPMNWGLAAVEAETPGALPLAAARDRLLARVAQRAGAPAPGPGEGS